MGPHGALAVFSCCHSGLSCHHCVHKQKPGCISLSHVGATCKRNRTHKLQLISGGQTVNNAGLSGCSAHARVFFYGESVLLCMLKQVGHSAVHAFRDAMIETV